jgi:hypothetical protein
MSPIRTLSTVLAIGTFALAIVSYAAATAGADSADQPAYKDGWALDSNGGTGFKGWKLVSSGSTGACGYFVGDSKAITSGSGGDINSTGKSFGLYGHGTGNSAEATRLFDSPLEAGQTFSVDIVVNYRNGNKGFDLRGADEKPIFNLNVGGDDYIINNATTGSGSIGNDFSDNTTIKLTFTQTSETGGTWTLTRTGGVSKSVNGTYAGVAAGIKFYASGTEEGPPNDLHLNNLAVTAPPAPPK